MPKRKCQVSYCHEYVELPERYCKKHKGESDKTYNREIRFNKDNRRYAAFYASSQWKHARIAQLAKQPLCEVCLQAGKVTKATIVHHKTEVREDWERRLDPDNLESICQTCHNQLHKTKQKD